ncbi:MAG: hypothetical protein ACXWQ5_00560 [Ktedonobacterales bacterium]
MLRYGDCDGFAEKEKAEELLNTLRTERGDKLKSGEVEPTLYARPDNVFYQIKVVYHDPEKTPLPVRNELRSVHDYAHLVVDGCVHEYSLGTMNQGSGNMWSHVTCHACHGEVLMDMDKVIEFILEAHGNKLGYERWEKKQSGN